MYYQIEDNIFPIQVNTVNPDKITVGIITLEELEKTYKQFSFSNTTVTECNNDNEHMHSNIDIYEDYCFGTINGINYNNILRVQDRMGIYI